MIEVKIVGFEDWKDGLFNMIINYPLVAVFVTIAYQLFNILLPEMVKAGLLPEKLNLVQVLIWSAILLLNRYHVMIKYSSKGGDEKIS